MAKLKMVRGTDEKIFFVESTHLGDKIMRLEFNESENYKITINKKKIN